MFLNAPIAGLALLSASIMAAPPIPAENFAIKEMREFARNWEGKYMMRKRFPDDCVEFCRRLVEIRISVNHLRPRPFQVEMLSQKEGETCPMDENMICPRTLETLSSEMPGKKVITEDGDGYLMLFLQKQTPRQLLEKTSSRREFQYSYQDYL